MRNLNNALKEGIYGGIKYSPDHICDGAGSGSGAFCCSNLNIETRPNNVPRS